MRKQYHFWPAESGEGFDAWDVDRLIALAAGLDVQQVSLDSIRELDTDYWSESGTDRTVRGMLWHLRTVLEVDTSYPIILGVDGRVMDGMHRICRAVLDNETTIRAVRFDIHPQPDYRNCQPTELSY